MENSISSDLIRGHIDTIILYSLIDSDKFAQQISDSIIEKSQNNYEINQATLYSSLKRLEKLNYVKAYWNDAPTGRRRYFKLTENGKKYIDDNLSNWNFSRSIIDKLLNISPKVVVEKVLIQPSEQPLQKTSDITEQSTQNLNVDIKTEEKNIENKNEVDKSQDTQFIKEKNYNIDKEINFRTILNGLVSVTKIVDSKKENEVIENQNIDKMDLSTAISENHTKVENQKNNLDFSFLEIMAEKEGFKIRFSNKNNVSKKGKILINKLSFFTSFIMSFLMIAELFTFSIVLNIFGKVSSLYYIFGSIIIVVPPLFYLVKFIIKNDKRIKSISASVMITMLIVFFDFLLLLFVFEWLLGFDFTNSYNLIAYFIIPCVCVIDLFLFSVIKFFLSKHSFFKTNKNL